MRALLPRLPAITPRGSPRFPGHFLESRFFCMELVSTKPKSSEASKEGVIVLEDVHQRILRVFEANRKTPGATFESDRFLAYLTHPPVSRGKRPADTFAGRRRFVRFMEAIQLEFGVCFTYEEWARGFAVEELAHSIEVKRNNREAQHKLAEKRSREARAHLVSEPLKFAIFAGALLILPGIRASGMWRPVLLGLWAAIVGIVAWVNLQQLRSARKLSRVIAAQH